MSIHQYLCLSRSLCLSTYWANILYDIVKLNREVRLHGGSRIEFLCITIIDSNVNIRLQQAHARGIRCTNIKERGHLFWYQVQKQVDTINRWLSPSHFYALGGNYGVFTLPENETDTDTNQLVQNQNSNLCWWLSQ